MKTLQRYTYMALSYLKFNIQRGLEYPAYLISWLICNPMQFFFGILTIQVVISNFQPLGGWEFEQLAFLYGLGVLSHGLSIVFFIQTWYMDYMVTQGEFDRMMLRPLNVFFQFCFMEFNFIGFTDLIPGLILFTYGLISVGFAFSFINILKLLIVIIGATLLRGGIYTLTGSLSFWIQRTHKLVEINLGLFDYTMKYPLSIYPKIIQAVFTFILPFGFVCFYPASEFLNMETDFDFPGSFCVWVLVIGVFVYFLGIKLFNFGLKRYESSGS